MDFSPHRTEQNFRIYEKETIPLSLHWSCSSLSFQKYCSCKGISLLKNNNERTSLLTTYEMHRKVSATKVTSCRDKFSKRETKTRGRSTPIMAFIFEDELMRDCSPFLHTVSFLSFLGGSFTMFTIRKKKKVCVLWRCVSALGKLPCSPF